ncbi:hypothetical protein NQ176_g60 [Zarea fungicola]|uniref:Uncharacterized protein n=1 Tax=Zarea fungicola TaxID=93591 RepID=A0ACC1NYT6_9HYPO|nr:hypothetical protein NQ176_g60 [Lecanicillium fungicola]
MSEATLSGFPTLQSALITKVRVGDLNDIGTGVVHNGSRFMHFATPTGALETVPGFEPAFKGYVNCGADWLSFDADGEHARIHLRSIAKTEQGYAIDFRFQGVIQLAPEVQKIFNMQPDAATVSFGFATGQHQFLVADPVLKKLEHSTFVSNVRILVGENGLAVETRLSLVIAAKVIN